MCCFFLILFASFEILLGGKHEPRKAHFLKEFTKRNELCLKHNAKSIHSPIQNSDRRIVHRTSLQFELNSFLLLKFRPVLKILLYCLYVVKNIKVLSSLLSLYIVQCTRMKGLNSLWGDQSYD